MNDAATRIFGFTDSGIRDRGYLMIVRVEDLVCSLTGLAADGVGVGAACWSGRRNRSRESAENGFPGPRRDTENSMGASGSLCADGRPCASQAHYAPAYR